MQRNEQRLERLELLHRAAQRFQPNAGQNSEVAPGCSSSSNGGGVIAKCERARSEFSRRRCERVQLPSPRGSAERRNFDGHEEDEEQNIHCQTNKQTNRRTSTTSSEASNPSHENAKPPGHRGRQLSHLRRLDKPCEHRRRDHSFLSSRSPKTNTKKRSKSSHKHTVPLTMYYVVLSLSSQLAT